MKQITIADTIGALCSDDYKGINNQYVGQGKVVIIESICGIPIRWLGGSAESRTTTGFRRKYGGGTESIVVEDKVVNEDGKGNVWESDNTASLTTTGGKPGQGYPCVRQNVYPIEGNGSRESHQGRGYSESNKMYTLNTVEQHAVAQVSTVGGAKHGYR